MNRLEGIAVSDGDAAWRAGHAGVGLRPRLGLGVAAGFHGFREERFGEVVGIVRPRCGVM